MSRSKEEEKKSKFSVDSKVFEVVGSFVSGPLLGTPPARCFFALQFSAC